MFYAAIANNSHRALYLKGVPPVRGGNPVLNVISGKAFVIHLWRSHKLTIWFGAKNNRALRGWGPGQLNFFSGRGVRPRFPECEACELTFASEKGGL